MSRCPSHIMGKFNNLSISVRLASGFALTLLMAVMIAATGMWRLQQVAGAAHDTLAAPLAKERLVAEWYTQIFGAVRRTAAIVKSSDPSLTAYFREDAAVTAKAAADLVKQIEPLVAGEKETALFRRIQEQRKAYGTARDNAVNRSARAFDLPRRASATSAGTGSCSTLPPPYSNLSRCSSSPAPRL